jgi:L-threonylcarbamoyladenylate synthase
MRTEVIAVDPFAPDAAVLARAAAVLRGGGLVAFPTETVYGLGANALDAAAVGRLFAAKGRPAQNPLIVHVAEEAQARELAADWPDAAAQLAPQFWPGPLTMVVRKRDVVPDVVTAGGPTVALRLPAHPVALALLRTAALPVAAPSANRSSTISPTMAEHVLRSLDGHLDLVLDGGPTPGGLESTVVDVTVAPPRLLRPGLIVPAELERVLGPITRPGAAAAEGAEALRSPGMLSRHYAPRAPLERHSEEWAWRAVGRLLLQGFRVGWLTFEVPENSGLAGMIGGQLQVQQLPREPVAYAAQLYAALHALDAAGVDHIVVTLPPDSEEWLAIRDRLLRASTQA